MIDSEFFSIWADWDGLPEAISVGTVRLVRKGQTRIPRFQFSDPWLARQDFRMLDPHLRLSRESQVPSTGRSSFGFLTDSTPNRWGRRLLQKHEVQLAQIEKRPVKRLDDFDVLFAVHDSMRSGGLSFRREETERVVEPTLSNEYPDAVPPWEQLPQLQAVVNASMQTPRPRDKDKTGFELILNPGASLGGSRPKAAVRDAAGLQWIAKFPSEKDAIDVGLWEYLIHQLAQEAGIAVPPARIEQLSQTGTIYLVRRFDRNGANRRVHFATARTLSGRSEAQEARASYLDVAEIIRKTGAHPRDDLQELWSRLVFNVAISNCDDHLGNHGFILETDGWRLSPAYDLNPDPNGSGLSLDIEPGENRLTVERLRSVARFFGLSQRTAARRLDEILAAVSNWRLLGRNLGIPRRELELMSPAFQAAF
jgi:serine/threonine-protein kinase HipA